jgi:hypothetical protein
MTVNHLIGANGYQPAVSAVWNVANGAGASAGAAVTVSLATLFQDQFGNGLLPPNYAVLVTPSQPAMVSVTGKTASGFSVTLTPLGSTQLAVGTFDVVVHS